MRELAVFVSVLLFVVVSPISAQPLGERVKALEEINQSLLCRIFDIAIIKDSDSFNASNFDRDIKTMNLEDWVKTNVELKYNKEKGLSQCYAEVTRYVRWQNENNRDMVRKKWLPQAFRALAACDCDSINKETAKKILEEWEKNEEALAKIKKLLEDAQSLLTKAKEASDKDAQDRMALKDEMNKLNVQLEGKLKSLGELEAKLNEVLAKLQAPTPAPAPQPTPTPAVSFDGKDIAEAIREQTRALQDIKPILQPRKEPKPKKPKARAEEKELLIMLNLGAGVGPADTDYGVSDWLSSQDTGTTTTYGGYGGSYGSARKGWTDPEISRKVNLRFCSLQNHQRSDYKGIEYGLAGWALDIEVSELKQKGTASGILFHEFQSINGIFTPGIQVFSPAGGAGFFIGLLGIGYSANVFRKGANYALVEDVVETGMEWAATEIKELPQGEARVNIDTQIWPVTVKLLPIELSFWLHKNLGTYISFSGLRLWAGESHLTLSWLDEEGNEVLVEDSNENSLLKDWRLVDTGFCLIKGFELEVGIVLKFNP